MNEYRQGREAVQSKIDKLEEGTRPEPQPEEETSLAKGTVELGEDDLAAILSEDEKRQLEENGEVIIEFGEGFRQKLAELADQKLAELADQHDLTHLYLLK